MSASQLVDLLGTPHAMYVIVDSSASDSVYSSVVSLGTSLAEVPVASVGTCVDTSLGAAPEDALLSFTLDSRASPWFFRDRTTLTPLPTPRVAAFSARHALGARGGFVARIGPVAALSGPVAARSGPVATRSGPVATRSGPVATRSSPVTALCGPVLQRFGFTYSSPQATPLPTRHLLSALPSDESVEPSGPYPELVGCLMYLMTCTRPDLAYPLSILARYVAPGRHRQEHMAAAKRVLRYLCSTLGLGLVLGGRSPVVLTGHADASWADDQATQRSSQGYTFSLGSGSVSWRATRSSSVLGSSCEAEIYAGAMAAQELRWLTYLLTDFGEVPRSPPVLYVDNKAMLALCREQRLEHRIKHIALRYFLARELQQRGQLRPAYVASEANTADIFTKALAPCDHERFCTQLGLVPVLPHLLTS
ncbi:unnamed protein product [Closterium sp. NIES-53]